MGITRAIKRNLAVRRRIQPKNNSEAELKQVVTNHLPLSPNVIIQLGEHRLVGYKKKVTNPKLLDNHFKKGENILYWHLEATDPKTIIKLLKYGTSKENKETLKRAGFSGFFGDVPNPNLRELYKKFGFTIIEAQIPKLVIARERIRYAKNIAIRKYPKEFLKTPFTRVILRFD